ncbi:MAG: MBL fold metallo-hydrolase [Gemmatimonadales bacterium]|nr:MBL fold metallo-hydrolase [Gemmatimonadales bacterium]
MTGRLVILGSGTSFGVPVIGCDCPVCRSDDPRDRRTRTAAVFEVGGVRLLIDTPPELRLQLVSAGIGSVDAVLYTHEHADHVAGIDDLRAFSVRGSTVPIYGPEGTLAELRRRFHYIFGPNDPAPGTSRPELAATPIRPYEELTIGGVGVIPIEVDHGGSTVFGYRVASVAYLTDAKSVPDRAIEALSGVDCLVLNALFERPHPTHLSIPEAIAIARRIGARRTYLTHLTHRQPHRALEARLPAGIEPAYDGLTISF